MEVQGLQGSGGGDQGAFNSPRTIQAGMNLTTRLNTYGFTIPGMNEQDADVEPGIQFGLPNDASFGSNHPGVVHFALADASARAFTEDTELRTLLLLASREDGLVVDLDQ